MNIEQNELDAVELGVASDETRGIGLRGVEPAGHPYDAGITDAD